MADEEIVLGADVTNALRGLGQVRNGVEDLGRAAGLTDKQVRALGQSTDRTMAKAIGQAVQMASAKQRETTATIRHTSAITAEAAAAKKLAEEERRVFETMGLIRNANGSVSRDLGGGRRSFASKETIETAKSYIRSLHEITEAEGRLEAQRNATAARASLHNRSQLGRGPMTPAVPVGTLRPAAASELAQVQKNLQAVRALTPDMISLRGILRDIPPVQWAANMGNAASRLTNLSNSARYALYSVAGGATAAGAAILGVGVLSTTAAIAHERAFANVRRTTQTTDEGYRQLQLRLQAMAMELPVTYEDITNIASAAGQLGINAPGVENFTRVVAMLTATTNLSADAAGNALARFRTFFNESEDPSLRVSESTFTNLASSILRVGINSIATESAIVNVSTQISSMGKLAGFTANQVIGFAGALASVGVAPELARGITTRLFTIIGDAVSAGGVQLEKFASISGVTAQQFKASWGTDQFAGTFTNFLQALGEMSTQGVDTNAVLRDLGITAVRDRPVWLRLAGAASSSGVSFGLLAETLNDAYRGWRENIELQVQYGKIAETTSARIQVMAQAFEQLFASMGEDTSSFVGDLAENVTGLVREFEEFSRSDAGKVLGNFVVIGSAVMGTLLLLVGGLAGMTAGAQAVGEAWREMGDKSVAASARMAAAFRIVAIASGIIGIVATIATTVAAFVAMGSAAEKASRPVQDMNGLLSAMKQDAEAGASGIEFFASKNEEAKRSAEATAAITDGMTASLYGVEGGGGAAASGLDSAADSARKAGYIFGDMATDFVKSQLLLNEGFQDIFDPKKAATLLADSIDVDLTLFDWDKIIQASSVGSEEVGAEIRKQISGQLDGADLGSLAGAPENLANKIAETFPSMVGDIQKGIDATQALADSTQHSVGEMVEDYELLDDVSQKTVDKMAQGFQKFADSSSLIGLTQKMNEIFGQTDVSSEDMASQWEEAWTDAYGGASFSIESYMDVFRRAAGEQSAFILNLQNLSARGLRSDIIEELAQMGPEATALVEALVAGTDQQLQEYEDLFGQTGYESMIKLATQTALGAEIVKNVLANKGMEGLRAFNESLASGVGVDSALQALQLDVNGKPIVPKVQEPSSDPLVQWWNRVKGGFYLPITPYLTQTTVRAAPGGDGVIGLSMRGWRSGGYTGNGGVNDVAGAVHGREFVMDAESTRSIGVNNLYAMMRAAKGGRSAPRGGGFRDGGYTGNGNNSNIVQLSPRDRELLARLETYIQIGDDVISKAGSASNFHDSRRGRG